MRRRTAIAFLCCMLAICAWPLVDPAEVHACSCAGPRPVQEEMNRKTAIFAGEVISVEPPRGGWSRSSAAPVEVTFEVTDVWKGQPGSKSKVYTALSGASCGYEGFVAGQTYIVFAYGPSDRLETGLCERTKPLSSASEELAVLGAGYEPIVATDDTIGESSGWMWGTVVAIAALAAAGFGFVFWLRRLRQR